MSLRRKIQFSVGSMLLGLSVLVGGGSVWMRLMGGLAGLAGLVLHWLWYRCPACGGRLNWSQNWTYCPHCGGWIDYDAK